MKNTSKKSITIFGKANYQYLMSMLMLVIPGVGVRSTQYGILPIYKVSIIYKDRKKYNHTK